MVRRAFSVYLSNMTLQSPRAVCIGGSVNFLNSTGLYVVCWPIIIFVHSVRKIHPMNLRINLMNPRVTITRSFAIVSATCLMLLAPAGTAALQSAPEQENTLGGRYLKNLFSDQKTIWTSPAKIRQDHIPWLIPFVSVSGGLFATDSNVAKQLSRSPSLISNSRNLANAG